MFRIKTEIRRHGHWERLAAGPIAGGTKTLPWSRITDPFSHTPYYSLTGGIPVASIFHPIMDKGQFIGIMGMDINFAKLQEIVESFMVLDDMYAIVTDMEGGHHCLS